MSFNINPCKAVLQKTNVSSNDINTINNYTPNINDRDNNYEKLSCLNNVNDEILSTTCNGIVMPLSKDQNVNCVEKYKLKPTYNVPNINGDCSTLL